MFDWLMSQNLSLSLITLLSLLVNAVTIYRWVSEKQDRDLMNNQAFHMIRGLALANTKRGNMIVQRIQSLESQGKHGDEAMIFLENTYSDTQSNIESLLATAKALKPKEADKLPYDGSALLAESMLESDTIRLKQKKITEELRK